MLSIVLFVQVDSAAELEKLYGTVRLRRDVDGCWPNDFDCMLVEVQYTRSSISTCTRS